MAHNKERLSHKPPVVRAEIGRGVIGETPIIGIYPTPTENSRHGVIGVVDISLTLAAVRETAKLRPGKRHSRNS